jgi:hypothetical protein
MGRGDKVKAGAAGFELQYLGPPAEPFSRETSTAQGKPTGSLPTASMTPADRPQRNVDPTSAPPKTKTTSQKAPGKAPKSWTSGFWKLW